MRTLFIGSDPLIFAPESGVRARLAMYADAIGELHVLSRGQGSEVHEGNLHLYPVHTWKAFAKHALTKRARMLINEKHIEVVSAQDPFEHGLAAFDATRGTSTKLHVQVHTDFLSPYFTKDSLKNRIRLHMANKVLPNASGIRVVSERIKQSLLAHYGTQVKIPSVIPISITSAAVTAAPFPKHFSFSLLTASRLEKEKRIEDILQAFVTIVANYPGTGLFIAGEGRERKALTHKARALGLGEHVVFLGWSDVAGLLPSASAYIQASAYEGYGATLIEAALATLPIITTDVGIVGEVLKAEESALVCPVAAPGCLTQKVERLIENNQLRSKLGTSAGFAAQAHLKSMGDIPARIAADLHQLV